VTIRYKLRTLLIVLALGPPLIGVAWKLSTDGWEWKVNDAELAFAMVVAFILTYFIACLIAVVLVACVIIAISWFIAKIHGRP
jgi:hypothetical protein